MLGAHTTLYWNRPTKSPLLAVRTSSEAQKLLTFRVLTFSDGHTAREATVTDLVSIE